MLRLFRRLAFFVRQRRAEDDLKAELLFHQEMARRDLERLGTSAADASAGARRAMGNTALAREDARAVWIAPWLDGLWQDIRHAVRSLRRSPALLVVSALSLGLGIGLNTMLYMAVSTIYGHEPTMAQPESMIGIEPGNANQFSYPDYRDLRRSGIFDDVLGFRTLTMNLRTGDEITPIAVLNVTSNFFDVLRLPAARGRTFSAHVAMPERDPRVVVVTSEFWRRRLQGDPARIGRTLTLNGEPFLLVGVLPEEYRAVTGWISPQVYVPVSRQTLPTMEERGSPVLSVLGRLKPGTTAEQARAAVTTLMASLERIYPDRLEGAGRSANVYPAGDVQFRGTSVGFRLFRPLGWVVTGVVLLIACLNVTGLLTARAARRRRDIAIRVAVGAGRARVVQALLVEAFLLVSAGAAIGIPVAFVFFSRVPLPDSMAPIRSALTMDSRVVPFALGIVAVATLVCGLVPALKATRGEVISEVRQSGETTTPRLRVRNTLVVSQMALSLVLMVAALLCVRSQMHVARVDVGFELNRGVVASFGLDPVQHPAGERPRLAERLVERIRQVPGVSSAAAANVIPLGGASLIRAFHPAGRTDIPGTRPSAFSVGPEYFETLAIQFVRGRDFDRSHVAGTPVAAIVNETFARTYFPGREAVGQVIHTAGEPEATIIGVVRDHKIDTIGEAPRSVAYFPYAQRPRSLIVHARTTVPPDALVSAIRAAVQDVEPLAPVTVETLRDAATPELTMRRVGTVLMASIGAVALLLAMIGLFGVMTNVAASRTTEVGIRMALGASASRIRWEMLQRALLLVAAGVAGGAIGSAGLMPAFTTFLAGVNPFDPLAFTGAAMILMIVGLAATYVPAYRTSRVDPVQALRHQ